MCCSWQQKWLGAEPLSNSQVLTSRSRETESLFDECHAQKERRKKREAIENNDKSSGCRQQWQEVPPGSVWSLEPRAWMSLYQQQQETGSGTVLNPQGANKKTHTHTLVSTTSEDITLTDIDFPETEPSLLLTYLKPNLNLRLTLT